MRKSLSIFSANLLYFITMLVIITLGSFIQSRNLTWGLIATEVFFILLPALLSLRFQRVPLREGLRWNRLPLASALACALLGFCIFLFSVIIEAVMAQLTGMASVPLPADSLPKGALESGLYFISLAVFAPLCEEILFRGAIQGAYEQERSAGFAIVVTGFLFAFYHFRLSGLPALLPAAFILGYVVWRTRSIFAGMLVHFGMNASSAANTLTALGTGKGLPFISLWSGLAGIAGTVLLILWLNRLHPQGGQAVSLPGLKGQTNSLSYKEPSEGRTVSSPYKWLSIYWPLIGAWILYSGVAGMTAVVRLIPSLSASADIQYRTPQIARETISHYLISNQGGKPVGEMTCAVTPQGTSFKMACSSSVQEYEIQVGKSYYKDVAHTSDWSATWDNQTLALQQYSFQRKNGDSLDYEANLANGQMTVKQADVIVITEFGASNWSEYEWFWRAEIVNANPNTTWKIPFLYLMRWQEGPNVSGPGMKNELLREYALEKLEVPAGVFDVWKITLGSQSAWYARVDEGYPRPVKFDDGMLVYVLTK